MRRCHPALPTLWLMTDERLGDALWTALARLPRGAGIVFRHHATPAAERRAVFDAVRAIARRRGLLLLLAGSPRQAIGWRADGAHGRSPHQHAARRLVRSAPVHDAREAWRACRADGDAVFVSPVFATRSHPGARTLGRFGFARLAQLAAAPAMALGGMTRAKARRLAPLGAAGWAAIDALAR